MRDGLRKLRHAGTHLSSVSLSLLFPCSSRPFLDVLSSRVFPLSFLLPRGTEVTARPLPPAEQAANRRKNIFLYPEPLGP